MKRKFRLCIFAFLAIAGMLLSLAACGKPSDQTVYPFADADFVDGSVGVFDTVPLRPLNAAELERVKGFLQDLELRQAVGEEDYYGGVFPCVQLRDANGTEHRIYCDDLRGDGVFLLYCTRFAESGSETHKYYIDEADMQAFAQKARALLEKEEIAGLKKHEEILLSRMETAETAQGSSV